MVKYITTEQTLNLRSTVLRNNMPMEQCIFSSDDTDGCFHLGCFVNESLVSVATFFPENYPGRLGTGFRLRGMATGPAYVGKGHGKEIINFAAKAVTSANGAYIWCNARSTALGFYKALGFDIISDEFEIPYIGPHFNMLKQLVIK